MSMKMMNLSSERVPIVAEDATLLSGFDRPQIDDKSINESAKRRCAKLFARSFKVKLIV